MTPAVDVTTVGETMAAFLREETGPGSAVPQSPPTDVARLTAIGAESNVAAGLALLGCRSRWVSRLGDDSLGRFIVGSLEQYGVDVDVDWDAEHPTGVCVKELGTDRTRVRYYRSQSAARYLDLVDAERLGSARWVHVTGVTPAISGSAARLVEGIVSRKVPHAAAVSFDLNYRPVLWPDAATAARTLVPLARGADMVFVGDDEADALFGTSDPDALAAQLISGANQELVLKRGGDTATVLTTAGQVSRPTHRVPVVDVTGAGDAFAAGYLAGTCFGWEVGERLRLGHALAARTIGVADDIAPVMGSEQRDEMFRTVRTPPLTRSEAG